jgi:hypothetical protein
MISLIVKQFGYGRIKPIKTDYPDNWMTFEFYDTPVGREISKFFGFQKAPVDYTITGLVCGAAEQLIKRKFITMESTCIGCGDQKCTIETLSQKHFEEKIQNLSNHEHKQTLKKILELEKRTDFDKESKKLMKNQNQKAIAIEEEYLKKQGIH